MSYHGSYSLVTFFPSTHKAKLANFGLLYYRLKFNSMSFPETSLKTNIQPNCSKLENPLKVVKFLRPKCLNIYLSLGIIITAALLLLWLCSVRCKKHRVQFCWNLQVNCVIDSYAKSAAAVLPRWRQLHSSSAGISHFYFFNQSKLKKLLFWCRIFIIKLKKLNN